MLNREDTRRINLGLRPKHSTPQANQILESLGLPTKRENEKSNRFVRKFFQARRQFWMDLQLQAGPSRSERTQTLKTARSATKRILKLLGTPERFDPDVDIEDTVPISIKVDLALGEASYKQRSDHAETTELSLSVLVVQLQEFFALSEAAIEIVASQENPGRGGDALDAFLLRLIELYEEATGKKPRLSRRATDSRPQGPLFRYLRLCIDPLYTAAPVAELTPARNKRQHLRLVPVEPKPPTDEALATRIRRLLNSRGKSV